LALLLLAQQVLICTLPLVCSHTRLLGCSLKQAVLLLLLLVCEQLVCQGSTTNQGRRPVLRELCPLQLLLLARGLLAEDV
jgi:hypothetical protein